YDIDPKFEVPGGGMKSDYITAPPFGGDGQEFASLHPGPVMNGPGGLDSSRGRSDIAGPGGPGRRLEGRKNHGYWVARDGGTDDTERAVAAALNWLARHQNPDGSWSLEKFSDRCRYGAKCDGPASLHSDSS